MSAAPRLLIDRADAWQLAKLAGEAYPKECCGLLIGRDHGADLCVTRVVASANLDPAGGARAFEIDTALQFDWQKTLRGTDERILGHYHSHPDGVAKPSATDLDRAWEPGQVWLILAARGPAAGAAGGAMAAFRYVERDDGLRAFEPLRLAPAEGG